MGAPLANTRPAGSGLPDEGELAAITVAQNLWGHGNLSPLDEIFENQALIALAPVKTAKFAIIAPHVGRRIQLYSKETTLWLDVFETDPSLARFNREKGVKAAFKVWDHSPSLLGEKKFTQVVVLRVAQRGAALPGLYAQVAKSLRGGGQIFAADLDMPIADSDRASLEAHREAIGQAGLQIKKETDISRELLLHIRQGFVHSMEKLTDLRDLEGTTKQHMAAAFCEQLERWAKVAILLEAGSAKAFGIVAALAS